MRRIDRLDGDINLLFTVENLNRASTEETAASVFIQQVRAILAGDPKLLGYLGFMYTQGAIRLHPYIKSLASEICVSIVKKQNDLEEADNFLSLLEDLSSVLEEYDAYKRRAQACFHCSDRWLSTYALNLQSILADSRALPSDKEAVEQIIKTIPTDVTFGTHKYHRSVKFSCSGTTGNVTIDGEVVDPSLFLAAGDYLNSIKITKVLSNTFEIEQSSSFSTNLVNPGYYDKAPVFLNINTSLDDNTLFRQLAGLTDTSDRHIKHGILLFGAPFESDYTDSVVFDFDSQTIAAYREIKKAEVSCGIPDALSVLTDDRWTTDPSSFLVNTNMYESAANVMSLIDSRSYR